MREIEAIRNEIDAVDERILEALAVRRKMTGQIMQAEDQKGAPIREAEREERLLANLIAKGRSQGLDAHFVTHVFHEIIDDSIRSQLPKRSPNCAAPRLRLRSWDAIRARIVRRKLDYKEALSGNRLTPDPPWILLAPQFPLR